MWRYSSNSPFATSHLLGYFFYFNFFPIFFLMSAAGFYGPWPVGWDQCFLIFLKQPCGFWRGVFSWKGGSMKSIYSLSCRGRPSSFLWLPLDKLGISRRNFHTERETFFFPTLTFCGTRLQKTKKKKKQCFKTFFTLFLSLSLIFFNVLFFFLPLFSLFLAYFFTWLFSFFFAVYVEFCSFILWFKYIYIYKTFPPVLLCFTLVPFFSLTFFFHIMFILVVFPIKNVPFFPSFLCF